MAKILVVGLGVSGRAAALFLLKQGHEVIGCDQAIEGKGDLYPVFDEKFPPEQFDFDQVVVSPGVSPKHPIYHKAIKLGIEVIGEAELAFRHLSNRVIGVTGTNGKSTTVTLITHILQLQGKKVELLGNIGTPLISVVGKVDPDAIIVAELSSYQLETMTTRCIDVGVLLNLTPNHLERHETMEGYLVAKLRLAQLVKPGGKFYIAGDIVDRYPDLCRPIDCIQIRGKYLLPPTHLEVEGANLPFSEAVCRDFGVSSEEFRKGLDSFKRLKHRIQFVREVGGVECYNDSKATTVDAVKHALEALGGDIILLVGGRYKEGTSFAFLHEKNRWRLRRVLIFGEAREIIAKQIEKTIPWTSVLTLQEAIEKGLNEAQKGDKLLLSPGCSSWDQFRSFEERGDAFIKGVEEYESKRYDFSGCPC